MKFRVPASSSGRFRGENYRFWASERLLTRNLGTLQGDSKNALASPPLELFAASNFGVIFKLDR
ncbi:MULTISPECIES: hypothetical protein [unclassified Microcoleus]|uniref:hypothetical protein n=1 Tax=unclassified Microcoleus TaxID=2642155 RepID=UPI002FD56835